MLLTVLGVFFGLVILCLVCDKLSAICRRIETQYVQEEEKQRKKEKKQVDPEKKVDVKQEEENKKKEIEIIL